MSLIDVQFFQVQDLLRIAKTNMVVTKLLAGGHKSGDKSCKPTFDFTLHSQIPIIKI